MVNFNSSYNGMLAILVASFLWGTTGTVASYAPDVSPLAIGAFAMGFGGILLLYSARRCLLQDYSIMFRQPRLVVLGGLCVAIYPLAFYSSMRFSGVAIGTVVSLASAPCFAAILDRFLSKKTISMQWLLSFAMGAIGIVMLAMGKAAGDIAKSDDTLQMTGILLGLVAGLTYAGYSWAAKHLIDNGVSSKSAVAGLFGCAAMLLLPSLLLTGNNLFTNKVNIAVSLYMAIIPMFLGYLLFGFGLKSIDASKATLLTLTEPLIATVLAVFIVGEEFQVIGWLGMVMVSLCLVVQSIKIPPKNVALPSEHKKWACSD
ncbi:MAG: DMT family transporter [Aestuariibacter sp.]